MSGDEEIRQLAYSIWEKEGRPEGKELEHWARASGQLAESTASPTKPGPTEAELTEKANRKKRANPAAKKQRGRKATKTG